MMDEEDYSSMPLGGKGKEKPTPERSFAEDGKEMALRGFVKALGMDPEAVDMGKAGKALHAYVIACNRADD